MKCLICGRKSQTNNYCKSHARAYENLLAAYDQWEKALKTSWKGYLREIVNNPLTGELAKETARYLMESGDQPDVKNR